MYNHTRHLALERLEAEAAEQGCNAVVDIIRRDHPRLARKSVREMLMVGTVVQPAVLRAAGNAVHCRS